MVNLADSAARTRSPITAVLKPAPAAVPAAAPTPEAFQDASGTAVVFDPPSNVRSSLGGDLLCSVHNKRMVNILDKQGSWYQTDTCGAIGWIHKSQVDFGDNPY